MVVGKKRMLHGNNECFIEQCPLWIWNCILVQFILYCFEMEVVGHK